MIIIFLFSRVQLYPAHTLCWLNGSLPMKEVEWVQLYMQVYNIRVSILLSRHYNRWYNSISGISSPFSDEFHNIFAITNYQMLKSNILFWSRYNCYHNFEMLFWFWRFYKVQKASTQISQDLTPITWSNITSYISKISTYTIDEVLKSKYLFQALNLVQ